MTDAPGRMGYQVRLEWGLVGALAMPTDVAVVVDVLSFSTCVCIAVERGMRVYPYAWNDPAAHSFAREHEAFLAARRVHSTSDGRSTPSLSPSSLLKCPPVPRIVLPSPNGSSIASSLQSADIMVVIGCLRNAKAVAERLAGELDRGRTVAVVAAGERWGSDGSLRPALEDHLGAGAVLAALNSLGYDPAMSPEASAAVAMFEGAEPYLLDWLRRCASGKELADRGFESDVEVAAALDVSRAVPVLEGDWFEASASLC